MPRLRFNQHHGGAPGVAALIEGLIPTGNNTWSNLLDPHPTSRGSAKNTFTAYQDVAGSASIPLPASYSNEIKVGTRVVAEAWGEFSNTATPTLQIGLIYGATVGAAGGTAIGQSGLITTTTGATAWPWHYKWGGIWTQVSATTGTLYGHGWLDLGTSLTALATSAAPVTAAARSVATLDTTGVKLWGLGATWGASSASNTITVDVFNVEIINQGKT